MDVNQPIITTGEFAGFTALHVACMENEIELVRLLIENYGADVNATAADGTQPILLACFYEKCHDDLCEYPENSTTGILAHAKANNDIEFGQEILSKHFKNRHWYNDFGDKIPLVAYLVLNDESEKADFFKECNVNIISLTNKSLLMYLVEMDRSFTIEKLMLFVKDPLLKDKLINHRDDYDVPLSHYPFHPKKYGNFRCHRDTVFGTTGYNFFMELLKSGADICIH
ncbi:Protein of unknown function [Cotesia congregata]|uniref:Uncharacterized protein n=1 Tax=Cotesia congregata TaxID=51543 RepID=A0A8J2MIY5_COTCN|nr:Protein of unknown function [Cotesia congregata]